MTAHHQMVLAVALLGLVGHKSAAIARASQTSHDPPKQVSPTAAFIEWTARRA
jgi:hypothetical protein